MDAPRRNLRLIETNLADGIELAWHPNCVKERMEASLPLLIAVLLIGGLLRLVIDACRRSDQELARFPDVIVAYEKITLWIVIALLMVIPFAVCCVFGRIWFDARRRRSILVRNGIVWFETSAKFEKCGITTPFALTDIARIVVQRVKWRRYPARMVECVDADGKRLLWRNQPVEIIDDLAKKIAELSGVPIEYQSSADLRRRTKR